jgi:hypothetical protein
VSNSGGGVASAWPEHSWEDWTAYLLQGSPDGGICRRSVYFVDGNRLGPKLSILSALMILGHSVMPARELTSRSASTERRAKKL